MVIIHVWYVVHVQSGGEGKACRYIKRAAELHLKAGGGSVLKECFVPMFQCEQKFHGSYQLIQRNLFPGYVIAVTNNVNELNIVMRRIPTLTKILGNDQKFIPLDRTEMAFINSFTSEKHRVIRVSRAVAEGDQISVVEGPMVGREGWIKKINRRKGTALVETVMFGRLIQAEIGLAVVSKAE